MKFTGWISNAVKKAESVAASAERALIAAVKEIDGIAIDAAALQPAIAQVVEAAVPGASKYANYGISLLEDVAAALDQGGTAAEQHFQNAGLDAGAISAIKALIPQIKALKV